MAATGATCTSPDAGKGADAGPEGCMPKATCGSRQPLGLSRFKLARLRMSLVWRALTVALLFIVSIIIGSADTRLDAWLKVPPRESGLVLIINAPVDFVTISSGNEPLQAIKWDRHAAPFVRQIRLDPGDYQLQLQGPIPSLNVTTKPGSLSYLRFGQYQAAPKENESGVYAVVITGTAHEAVSALQSAADIGIPDVYDTPFVRPRNNILMVNTEPPWPIPPQPQPPQPQSPKPKE